MGIYGHSVTMVLYTVTSISRGLYVLCAVCLVYGIRNSVFPSSHADVLLIMYNENLSKATIYVL